MPDQEPDLTAKEDNRIEASIRASRHARSVLDPADSPEQIRKRYLAEAGQYFFRDRNNALAFEDRGAKIATQTEDPVVAASMVDLAIAKGWKELKVTGSESFRKTVWLEAAKRGMTIRGYEPKPQDELQLKEALSKKPSILSVNEIGPARFRAFTEQTKDEAIKVYPELAKAYAGQEAIHQWISANIPNPAKQEELRAAVNKGMAERLNKGEIPAVVVLPEGENPDPQQGRAIHKQAIVMGAVAQAKGYPPEKVRIVIAAAERIGRHLASKGTWIPEPMVYDRNAPPGRSQTSGRDDSVKPEIQRQPRILPRR